MSIAQLKKISLFGQLAQKQAILNDLQALGCMHLVALQQPSTEIEKLTSPRAKAAYKALHFLTAVPHKRRQVVRETTFDVDKLVDQALELKQLLRDVCDRRDFLQDRIATIEPWGDINFPPKGRLAGYRLWFYVLPLGMLSALKQVELPWQILRKGNRFAYVVLISQQEPPSNILPVARSHIGALPLAQLREQLDDVEIELEDLAARRQALTRYIYLLNVNLAQADNRASLAFAAQHTRDESTIVVVQGWVPIAAVDEVQAWTEQKNLACLIENPQPDETVPTLIEQPESLDAGVDLTEFYQVPGYHSWDPTRLLFVSFSVFFAMILADAGYGLILMAVLLACWRRLGQSRKGRAYRLLGLSLSACTMVYGAIVGSYFGIEPATDSVLHSVHILDINDFDTMMMLSIGVGVLHVGLANAMVVYVNRHRLIALSKAGWIALTVGGMLFWLSSAGEPYNSGRIISVSLLIAGLLAILLFSSERPIKKTSDYFWRFTDGIFSLKGVLNLFGDVLSYMRLFALGLASASMAVTFNGLARDALEASPGIGLLAALLILGIGHVLNLMLSLISGVVHGLRLNFIEFYNWGQPEEGTSFQTFSRKEVKR